MKIDEEEWRPIPGYPYHSASSYGRISLSERTVKSANQNSRFDYKRKGRILSPASDKSSPYPRVRLHDGKRVAIHVLVCLAFHGPRPDGMQIRHIDGDITNPRPNNLKYGTPKENAADKILHGTDPVGERHPMAILNESSVLAIRGRRDNGETLRQIAEDYNVSISTIHLACKKRNWRHV